MDVDTPLKTNMSLKRGPFQKESSLPTTIFRGHLSFRVSKFNLDDNAYMHIYICPSAIHGTNICTYIYHNFNTKCGRWIYHFHGSYGHTKAPWTEPKSLENEVRASRAFSSGNSWKASGVKSIFVEGKSTRLTFPDVEGIKISVCFWWLFGWIFQYDWKIYWTNMGISPWLNIWTLHELIEKGSDYKNSYVCMAKVALLASKWCFTSPWRSENSGKHVVDCLYGKVS